MSKNSTQKGESNREGLSRISIYLDPVERLLSSAENASVIVRDNCISYSTDFGEGDEFSSNFVTAISGLVLSCMDGFQDIEHFRTESLD